MTAIQELEEILKDNLKEIVLKQDYKLMQELFSKALEKEKNQIINAFDMGRDETTRKFIEDGEHYYNKS